MAGVFALRPLGTLELDVASGLHRESFGPMGERVWTRQDIAELLASPGVSGLLLQADGQDIGFALCRTVADESELLSVAVHAGHRRRGAGRALLQAIADHVRTAGAAALFLEVGADNPAAQFLYTRMGFQAVGRRAAYYGRGQAPPADAIVMRLILN